MGIEETFRAIIRAEVEPLRREIRSLLERKSTDGEALKKKEAAAFIDVSPDTLTKWVKRGLLKPVGKGRLARYEKADLRRALEQAGAEGEAPPPSPKARAASILSKAKR